MGMVVVRVNVVTKWMLVAVCSSVRVYESQEIALQRLHTSESFISFTGRTGRTGVSKGGWIDGGWTDRGWIDVSGGGSIGVVRGGGGWDGRSSDTGGFCG